MKKRLLAFTFVLVFVAMICIVYPVESYTGANFADIDQWHVYEVVNGYGKIGGGIWSTIDPTTTYNGNPSIKCLPSALNNIAETDGPNDLAIRPNEHIYYSIYAKTSSWGGATDYAAGSWFGFDFKINGYVNGKAVNGIAVIDQSSGLQAGHPTQDELGYTTAGYRRSINGASGLRQVNGLIISTPFNTDWTLLEWDFTVPTHTFNFIITDCVDGHMAIWALDSPVQISGMTPWIGVHDDPNIGHAVWFADPVLYINPSGSHSQSSNSSTFLVLLLLAFFALAGLLLELIYKNKRRNTRIKKIVEEDITAALVQQSFLITNTEQKTDYQGQVKKMKKTLIIQDRKHIKNNVG